jgi:hypothetical protein
MATETPEQKRKRLQEEAAKRAAEQRERRKAEAQAEAGRPSSVQGRTQEAAAEFKPDMGLKRGGKVKKYAGGGGIKKLLGAVSPLYAAMNPDEASGPLRGLGGIVPMMMRGSRKRRPDGTEMTEGEEAASGRPTMRNGGKVKKYARGGGVESKGKTKGRFV